MCKLYEMSIIYYLKQPFKYESNDPNGEPQPLYENGTYVDEWDQENVRLPCSQSYITVSFKSKNQSLLNKYRTGNKRVMLNKVIKKHHFAEYRYAVINVDTQRKLISKLIDEFDICRSDQSIGDDYQFYLQMLLIALLKIN